MVTNLHVTASSHNFMLCTVELACGFATFSYMGSCTSTCPEGQIADTKSRECLAVNSEFEKENMRCCLCTPALYVCSEAVVLPLSAA